MSDARRRTLLAAACAAAAAAVFLPAAGFPFLNWDDGIMVAYNPNFRGFGMAALAWDFSPSPGTYQPLGYLSYALDAAVWGPGPFGFHLTNVLLHALDAALLFLLARRLLSAEGADAVGAEAGAVFASLAWALHPLRVESVAWISERRDVLCGAFVLLSALAWVEGALSGETPEGRARRRAALALGCAAMAVKVFSVVLPLVFLILDARLRGAPRWKEKLPWLIPAAASVALNVVAQERSGASASLAVFGATARVMQGAYGLGFYARKTLWPSGLGPLYERSLLLEPIPFIASASAVIVAVVVLWRQRGRRPAVVHAALAFALFSLPALGLFKSGRMTAADRYSYLPAIPLALLAGAALARARRAWPARAAAAAAVVLLALAARRQLPVWSSDAALWTRACEVSPLSFFARLKLAQAEAAAGRPEAAAAARAEAERLHAEVFSRAAELYAARGNEAAAVRARERAQGGLSGF